MRKLRTGRADSGGGGSGGPGPGRSGHHRRESWWRWY